MGVSTMAENAGRAKHELKGQRRAVSEHVEEYRRYAQEGSPQKETALRTIKIAQRHIAKLKSTHPSLSKDSSWEDNWRP
jgi:hypothetical protein